MTFDSVEQKVSYGVGRQMGEQLAGNSFDGVDIAAVQAGLADAFAGQPSAVPGPELQEAFAVISQRLAEAQEAKAKAAAAEGEAFLADNAKREGVQVTASGLQYEVLAEGEGDKPGLQDTVRCHYHGMFIDGRVFDSSVERGEPAEFPVSGVIAGWTEALQLMSPGTKLKLYIPHQLAYGERGAGGAIPPFSALVFEVELLAIA
ncbi:FKBP-type peptidyl-prolyl cis-trans isomerase [Ferrimonas balearica]|uniref:FKBP-type peptidyl-prolyl cis-trans isomerase n=1 Tax=Ferrimonas balearica TaxID=44012 RepID=UPI001C994610|nr:FKBP-type peptidyl-prolyl cis-trans isomerase [Ferrimonas balearica]MBY5921859.1 FKBP-type peptidyl-prolyl cis-trans isomerase [Ferrimonas balearica]MBY5994801.1 FKBP-type peptidyl-prolyl cis-trans isomerase [Ferrimonas balearica]